MFNQLFNLFSIFNWNNLYKKDIVKKYNYLPVKFLIVKNKNKIFL